MAQSTIAHDSMACIERLISFLRDMPETEVQRLAKSEGTLPDKLLHFDQLLRSLPGDLRRRISAAFNHRLSDLLFPFHVIAINAVCDKRIAAIDTHGDQEDALKSIDSEFSQIAGMYAGE